MKFLINKINLSNRVVNLKSKIRTLLPKHLDAYTTSSSLANSNRFKITYILLCILPVLNLLFIAMYSANIFNFLYLIKIFSLLFFIIIALIFINCIQNTKYLQIFSNLIFLAATNVTNKDIEDQTKKIQKVLTPFQRYLHGEINWTEFSNLDPETAWYIKCGVSVTVVLLFWLYHRKGASNSSTGNSVTEDSNIQSGTIAPLPDDELARFLYDLYMRKFT